MGRAGEAVNAAMLAAAIRVDGLLERDVGRTIASDNGFACIADQNGPERRRIILISGALPAVIDRLGRQPLVPVGLIGNRTSTFDGAFGGRIG